MELRAIVDTQRQQLAEVQGRYKTMHAEVRSTAYPTTHMSL